MFNTITEITVMKNIQYDHCNWTVFGQFLFLFYFKQDILYIYFLFELIFVLLVLSPNITL